jgi:hypothetical protein
MNAAKVILILVFLLLLIIIFFALTGLDVRNPMPTVVRILDWVVQLNRTLSKMLQDFLFSVRMSIKERFQ